MSITAETIDRLKAQLLTSGLSQRNNALFQVINLLIDALRQGLNELETQIITITPPSNPSGGGTIITSGAPLGDINTSDEETDWMWGPPGPQGKQGIQGPQGMPGMDGEDCDCESMPFVATTLYP